MCFFKHAFNYRINHKYHIEIKKSFLYLHPLFVYFSWFMSETGNQMLFLYSKQTDTVIHRSISSSDADFCLKTRMAPGCLFLA